MVERPSSPGCLGCWDVRWLDGELSWDLHYAFCVVSFSDYISTPQVCKNNGLFSLAYQCSRLSFEFDLYWHNDFKLMMMFGTGFAVGVMALSLTVFSVLQCSSSAAEECRLPSPWTPLKPPAMRTYLRLGWNCCKFLPNEHMNAWNCVNKKLLRFYQKDKLGKYNILLSTH